MLFSSHTFKRLFFFLPRRCASKCESFSALYLSASVICGCVGSTRRVVCPLGAAPARTRAFAFRHVALWAMINLWELSLCLSSSSAEPKGAGGQQGYQWQEAPIPHYWDAWIALGFSWDHWHRIFLGLRCSTVVRPVTPQCPLSLSSVSATVVHLEWGCDDIRQLHLHTIKYTYTRTLI